MIEVLDGCEEDMKILIVKYLARYNMRSLFEVSPNLPFYALYNYLLAVLEEYDEVKVERVVKKMWTICLERAGKKSPETYELAKVMLDF